LLKAFVSRVNRRICIRMVRFWRSTWLVQILASSGFPLITTLTAPVHSAGEWLAVYSATHPVTLPQMGQRMPIILLVLGGRLSGLPGKLQEQLLDAQP